ncbi:MAG: DUF5916 domain-containing protein [Vicinamibacterales bacterium]|nr:DUF5916 domain-containing protein [Vicinamibacterales bacterium]
MIRTRSGCGMAALILAATAVSASAQQHSLPALIDAPVPPVGPATIARDPQGRATLRAIRAPQPLTIDGRLDEAIYETVPPAGGWIQQTPQPGAPVTEPTDVWVFFDDTSLYIGMYLHETHPERRIGTELRRDAQGLTNDDNVMLVLDTFYDRHNAFNFQVNSVGGFRDQFITDGAANGAWNTIWYVKTANAKDGWSFEMRIPFKSLRYAGAGPQVWGFNARRTTKWKNEMSYINPVPVAYGGPGINILSTAATLVGVETPSNTMNLELKPYGITSLTTDKTTARPFSNDPTANGGFDFKYGITRGLTADMTVNTDFAQVEEDVQQVNLTRFSLFFPEKRDFFLEGLGNFGFAGQGTGSNMDGVAEVPTLFFSRRIGLNNGSVIPVRLGGRVTGRAKGFEIGLLNIQTGEKPEARTASTNFTAARVRRQVLRRSNVGFITTMRSPGGPGTESFSGGVDANFRFYDNIENNLYFARTSEPRAGASDTVSYRARFGYVPDRYGIEIEQLKIGKDFAPEMGFVRRPDYRNSSASLRFSPRLKKHKHIRQFFWTYNLDYITNSASSQVENRNNQAEFAIDLHNSDRFSATYIDQYEFIPAAFTISPGVRIPRDRFNYETFRVSYTLGNQRKVAGTVSAQTGTLYNGDRTTVSYSGRLSFSPRFVMEPSVSFNRVSLPYGDFDANLLSTRIIVTPQPRMQVMSLLQWNQSAKTMTSSVRLRWEYIPGSDFFVVFTDGRNTPDSLNPGLLNRTLAVKLTRLLRF